MKIKSQSQTRRGFTIPEILTAMSIFTVLIGATVSMQVFGLRMYRISEAKLSSTGNARNALNRVRDEVRSASLLYVGNANGTSFTGSSNTAPCVGNALKICATGNTNNYVYYYLDATNSCLMRKVSGKPQLEVISRYVTNSVVFQAEDFQGNIINNNSNNRIIRMDLHFYKVEYPTTTGGSANVCEAYRLQTRIARRAL